MPMFSSQFPLESVMTTQHLVSSAQLLSLAKPDRILLTVAAMVLSPAGCGESFLDMTHRVCDRYFGGAAEKEQPAAKKAA
jgi:hypothetical protein